MRLLLWVVFLMLLATNTEAQFLKYVEPNNITNLHKGTGEIILTIDDGPSTHTELLLDVLNEQSVQGTFFVLGKSIKRYPRTMDRMLSEGHVIANHTDTHKNLKKLSSRAIKREIEKMYLESFPYFGNGDYLYFRSPYGAWDSRVAKAVNQTRYARDMRGPIFWDIGGVLTIRNGRVERSADWDCWKRKLSVSRCLQGYVNETIKHRGGVVLFHELNIKSIQLIKQYIVSMKNRGYKFVSIDVLNL